MESGLAGMKGTMVCAPCAHLTTGARGETSWPRTSETKSLFREVVGRGGLIGVDSWTGGGESRRAGAELEITDKGASSGLGGTDVKGESTAGVGSGSEGVGEG